MSKPINTNSSIDGITELEAHMLRSLLLFLRAMKPYEVMEIKLNDNRVGEYAIVVKTNYKEIFNLTQI